MRGVSSIPALIDAVRAQGSSAVALTDTNGLYGTIRFVEEARQAGLRPILGVELVTDRRRAVLLKQQRISDLLDRCHQELGASGELEPLDRAFWEGQIDALSAEGLRVLAAAAREVADSKSELALEDLDEDMVFLGLIGIIDPPRPEAIAAIKSCHEAGIGRFFFFRTSVLTQKPAKYPVVANHRCWGSLKMVFTSSMPFGL